jgi:hypothetical protein
MIHVTPLIGTITGIGDRAYTRGLPEAGEWIPLHVFAVLMFGTAQWLIFVNQQTHVRARNEVRFLAGLVQFSLSFLVGYYEFWIKPTFVEHYASSFADLILPKLTAFLIIGIPSGVLVCVVTSIAIANFWLFAREEERKRSIHNVLQRIFLAFGIAFLVFVPIALFLPYF